MTRLSFLISLIVESLGFTRFQVTLLGTLDGMIESMSNENTLSSLCSPLASVAVITIYTGVKLVEKFGDARAYVGSAYMVSDVLSAILVTSLPWSNKIGLLISVYLTGAYTSISFMAAYPSVISGRYWDDWVCTRVGLDDI